MQDKRNNPAYKAKIAAPRLIRCSLCGKYINTMDAFCVVKGPKRFYYCSREEYEGGEEYIAKREWREKRIAENVRYIIGADELIHASYDPTFLEWLKYASIDNLNDFLNEKSEELERLVSNKGILQTENKLKYLTTYIKGNIQKYVDSKPRDIPSTKNDFDNELYTPKLTPRSGLRRSMEDIEDEYDTEA